MVSDETLRVDPAAMQGFSAALCVGAEGPRARLAELDVVLVARMARRGSCGIAGPVR